MATDERFLSEYRLRKQSDFKRAFQRRWSAGDDVILVFAHPNELTYPRLGLSVSRKVGNAVVRNRWKRLLREAFRRRRTELPNDVDLVVVPRAGHEPELVAIGESLTRLAWRAARKIRI